MASTSTHISTLTKDDSLLLKGIAICAMLCHHLFTCVPKNIEMTFSGIPLILGQVGKFCIALFVLVSGYGMAISFNQIHSTHPITFPDCWKRYLLAVTKRLIHFFLQYWTIFFIFVPIGVLCFHRPLSTVYGENVNLVKHLLFDLSGLKGFASYNTTWWFNKLILLLYFLSPVYFLLIRKACIPSLVFFFLLSRFSGHIHVHFYSIDIYSFAFAIGMSLALYGKVILCIHEKHPFWLNILTSLFVIILFILFRYLNWFRMGGLRADSIIAFGFALLVTSSSRMSRIRRPFILLGKHSANIYLTHTFIYFYWFSSFVYNMKDPILIFGLLLLICLSISIAIEWFKRVSGIHHLQISIDKKLSLL